MRNQVTEFVVLQNNFHMMVADKHNETAKKIYAEFIKTDVSVYLFVVHVYALIRPLYMSALISPAHIWMDALILSYKCRGKETRLHNLLITSDCITMLISTNLF